MPLELQPPPSVTPSKYDLANRRIGLVLDDKWRLDELLGVGGMAAVYAATHRNGARAAIKLLPFSVATGPEICQRLLREGYLANRIKHPAVTRVLDDQIDYDKEHAYIVMELLDGETARERVERLGPLQPTEAVSMMLELADCLSAAHAANVIHRDIKPENLFLTDSGLKVLDFGIARALDGNSNLTQTGTSLGTPAYMSPEQARGKHEEISPCSDIYSLGATLLFLISGRTLHEGENALELMVRAAWTPALPARSICSAIPRDLASVIDRCCAFDQADRFQSADEVIRALSELKNLPKEPLSQPPPGDTPSQLRLSRSDVIRSLPATAETLRGSTPPRRASGKKLGLALALVVTLAGGAWALRANRAAVGSTQALGESAADDEQAVAVPAVSATAAAVSAPAAVEPAPADDGESAAVPSAEPANVTAATSTTAAPTPPRKSAPAPKTRPAQSSGPKSAAFPKISPTQKQKQPPDGAKSKPASKKAPIIDYERYRRGAQN